MKPSSVFIYDNITSLGAPGGVARYFNHVRDCLIAHFGDQITIFSPRLKNYDPARHFRGLPENFKGSGWLRIQQVNAFLAGRITKRYSSAFFYSPYYGNVQTKAAQIFTVYDMIHELYFPKTRASQAFIEEKKRCIEQAALLIAISKSTAHDVISCYPQVDPAKIETIWLGVDDFFFGVPKEHKTGRKPYFLYVGARNGYKNFQRTVQAFGQSGLAKDFNLLVISPDIGDRFNDIELALLNRYKLENTVNLHLAVSETELRSSYSGAVALIYPSEYEGFGLPVLEAMASGTIIAASNAASIPETGGNVALYFDPKSVDSIANTLQDVASLSEIDRRAKIDQGISRAKQFSWARCQQETVKVIENLVNS